jgi:predicted alpha/beta-fold hydrolase
MNSYAPTGWLQNPHVQSVLASTFPRRLRIAPLLPAFNKASKTVVLDCGDGQQLLGEYSQQTGRSKGLVTLIHGWEGSSKSSYMLSSGAQLFNAGYDIFRLNLRDHGPSHHLNKELFHSARLQEVVEAVRYIHQTYPHDWQFLAGFSLGGNFALRVAAKAAQEGLSLHQTVAICPVLNPAKTMAALETGWWVYERYFVKKWKASLRKKLALYPELNYGEKLLSLKNLSDMNEYFVPNFTPYPSTQAYFNAYSLTEEVLESLDSPAHIIASKDDPMILAEDLAQLANNPKLDIEQTEFGGHCGFLKNYRLDSWLDTRLVDVINHRRYAAAEAQVSAM